MPDMRDSFLPSIKCSECQAEVEIALMADHVCGSATPAAPAAQKKERKAGFQFLKAIKTSSKSFKSAAIPRIDSAAANKPFLGQAASPQAANPPPWPGPAAAPRDGQPPRPPDSPGAVRARDQPPRTAADGEGESPLYNIDCAFPPFQSPLQSPIRSPTSPSDSPTVPGFYPPRSNSLAPKSPTATGSTSVLARMNTIAPGPFGVGGQSKEKPPEILPSIAASFPERKSSKSGPDAVGRDSQAWRETRGPMKFGFEDLKMHPVPEIPGARAIKRDTMDEVIEEAIESHDFPLPPSAGLRSSSGWFGAAKAAEPPKPDALDPDEAREGTRNAYAEFSGSPYGHRPNRSEAGPALSRAETTRASRSNTSPEELQRAPSARVPPHPGIGLPAGPSATKNLLKESLVKALPPAPLPSPPAPDPPRKFDRLGDDMVPNRTRSPSPARPKSPPPQQRPGVRTGTPPRTNNYVDETRTNYSRSTTQSVSSNASSTNSHLSSRSDSSMSSAPTSVVSSAPKFPGPPLVEDQREDTYRAQKEMGLIDGLMASLEGSMSNLGKTPPSLEPHGQSKTSPHQNRLNVPSDREVRQAVPPQLTSSPLESELSPPLAPEFGLPPSSIGYPRNPPRTASPVQLQNDQPFYEDRHMSQHSYSSRSHSHDDYTNPPIPPTPSSSDEPHSTRSRSSSRKGSQSHRRTPTSKGFCRGCNEPIIGKSISSADGRLTGRYHKHCFVCQTCREPFQSAEFYVMDNWPYCERHYHQLNNSLCPTCDRGIEGPCQETERGERFHPRCFCCVQCRVPLGEDYFEIHGRPYCQRDAYNYGRPRPMPGSRLGPNPGRPMLNPNVERRKTRIMMMGPNTNGLQGMGGMNGMGSLVGMADMDMRMPRPPMNGRAF